MFTYPIYNHNWRNIGTIYIYIYITRLASNEIFSPSNKIQREVGRAKDLSALLYEQQLIYTLTSLYPYTLHTLTMTVSGQIFTKLKLPRQSFAKPKSDKIWSFHGRTDGYCLHI